MSPLLLILILILIFGGGGGYYAYGPRGGIRNRRNRNHYSDRSASDRPPIKRTAGGDSVNNPSPPASYTHRTSLARGFRRTQGRNP